MKDGRCALADFLPFLLQFSLCFLEGKGERGRQVLSTPGFTYGIVDRLFKRSAGHGADQHPQKSDQYEGADIFIPLEGSGSLFSLFLLSDNGSPGFGFLTKPQLFK